MRFGLFSRQARHRHRGAGHQPARRRCADDKDSYDFGRGAGFYLDATQEPWRKHYRMYSYLTQELPWLVASNLPSTPRGSASSAIPWAGMRAHAGAEEPAALQVGFLLLHPSRRRCAPWGEKALANYLGDDRTTWRNYDTTALIESRGWKGPPPLVDQGTKDRSSPTQLKAGTAARSLHEGRRGARPAPARGLRPQLFIARMSSRNTCASTRSTWPRQPAAAGACSSRFRQFPRKRGPWIRFGFPLSRE